MKRLICLFAVAALAGCSGPELAGANQAGGMVGNVKMAGIGSNQADGFALANNHCQRYGKIARMTNRMGGNSENSYSTLAFDCVAP